MPSPASSRPLALLALLALLSRCRPGRRIGGPAGRVKQRCRVRAGRGHSQPTWPESAHVHSARLREARRDRVGSHAPCQPGARSARHRSLRRSGRLHRVAPSCPSCPACPSRLSRPTCPSCPAVSRPSPRQPSARPTPARRAPRRGACRERARWRPTSREFARGHSTATRLRWRSPAAQTVLEQVSEDVHLVLLRCVPVRHHPRHFGALHEAGPDLTDPLHQCRRPRLPPGDDLQFDLRERPRLLFDLRHERLRIMRSLTSRLFHWPMGRSIPAHRSVRHRRSAATFNGQARSDVAATAAVRM